jgi:3-hydroxyisobutyrate dehydrogenase-like beta-hydroxyacid dehydrogenase
MAADVRVGIIGVGNMGGRMGRCVADGGVSIVAYDRDPERLAASGLPGAESAEALVGAVDVVLLSLPDSGIIEPLILGERGLLPAFRDGQIVVDLSTASPESTRRIGAALEDRGVALVDAGISGGAKAAEAGTLTLMTGGDAAALERVRPVLDHFAAKIVAMGPLGSGHATKILNNFLNGVSLAATAEAMVAAKRAGLDLDKVLEVVNASSGVNFATLNRFPSIVKGDYLEGGLTGKLMAKDLRLYLDFVSRVGAPTFAGPASLAAFEVANGLGYGDVISNRVVDGLGDLAGGVRLHDGQAGPQR